MDSMPSHEERANHGVTDVSANTILWSIFGVHSFGLSKSWHLALRKPIFNEPSQSANE